jgi:hypothetical protein
MLEGSGDGDTVQTFTIITIVPNALCGAVHVVCPSCYRANDGPHGWGSATSIRTSYGGWS